MSNSIYAYYDDCTEETQTKELKENGTLCIKCGYLNTSLYPDEEDNKLLKTPPGKPYLCSTCRSR